MDDEQNRRQRILYIQALIFIFIFSRTKCMPYITYYIAQGKDQNLILQEI